MSVMMIRSCMLNNPKGRFLTTFYKKFVFKLGLHRRLQLVQSDFDRKISIKVVPDSLCYENLPKLCNNSISA